MCVCVGGGGGGVGDGVAIGFLIFNIIKCFLQH